MTSPAGGCADSDGVRSFVDPDVTEIPTTALEALVPDPRWHWIDGSGQQNASDPADLLIGSVDLSGAAPARR